MRSERLRELKSLQEITLRHLLGAFGDSKFSPPSTPHENQRYDKKGDTAKGYRKALKLDPHHIYAKSALKRLGVSP
jgi:hypothetical protein